MSGSLPVQYVRIGEESVAYRGCGGSGLQIVYLGTNGSHQDLIWDEPGYAHLLRSLAALGRLVTFDRRGAGLSSRTVKPTVPSPMTALVIEPVHGVAARGPLEATAFPYRREGYAVLLCGQWEDPADNEANISWVRETFAALTRT